MLMSFETNNNSPQREKIFNSYLSTPLITGRNISLFVSVGSYTPPLPPLGFGEKAFGTSMPLSS